MRITDKSSGYDACIVYLDGRKFVDFKSADNVTGEVEVIRNNKREVLRGKKLEIVLNAGSSRFE